MTIHCDYTILIKISNFSWKQYIIALKKVSFEICLVFDATLYNQFHAWISRLTSSYQGFIVTPLCK